MALFNWFKDKEPRSADVAKERLKVIVAHERSQRNAPDYLPALQQDIMAVIRKYVEIDQDQLQVDLNEEGNYSVLEVNVNLPK
ncbi:cell division topological specificity factor MinE [Saccharospirillum salsuginis]|uniref:Cell division topological specificity factor n=1 Tax=Saccharospirillum salsuginis TaxID=418750 RepID=A0A918NI96_9GAMM|nr:cell division topological specificity factor MinE [Saccharospirillum salsuginis]GGX69480.1 cell division topological specificity factor [Saccharospirillum salsuginis]